MEESYWSGYVSGMGSRSRLMPNIMKWKEAGGGLTALYRRHLYDYWMRGLVSDLSFHVCTGYRELGHCGG